MNQPPFNSLDEFYAWVNETFRASRDLAVELAARLEMPEPVHFGSVSLTGEQDGAGFTTTMTMWAPTASAADFAELIGWLEHGLAVHVGMRLPDRKPRMTVRDSKGRFTRP